MKHILFISIIIVCCVIILADAMYLSKNSESLTTIDENSNMTRGYDTKFHDSIEDIKEQSSAYIPQTEKIEVTDNSGNKIKIDMPKILAGQNYYKPGTYKYGASTYVPDYEDSIYLSRSIGVVPRLKSEFYVPSTNYALNSLETPYNESDSLITNDLDTSKNASATATIPAEQSNASVTNSPIVLRKSKKDIYKIAIGTPIS
jgi:hypothetical protein